MARTKNLAEAIRKEIAKDRALSAEIEQHAFDAEVAAIVYAARKEARLTQQELADLVGTQQSVIARLEDWDYSGHSLTMLKRIGDSLGKRLHVEFRPRFTDFQQHASNQVAELLPDLQWRQISPWSPTIRSSGAVSDNLEDVYGLVA